MKVMAGVLAVAAAASALAISSTGAADAAGRPSVRACAVLENGRPYVGPMTLERRTNNWTRTLNSAPSGCMIWQNLSPGRAFRVEVNYGGFCNRPYNGNSTIQTPGTAMTTTGATPWKVTGPSGQLELGTFVVRTIATTCYS